MIAEQLRARYTTQRQRTSGLSSHTNISTHYSQRHISWSQEAEYLKEFAEDWAKGLELNYQVGPQLGHHRGQFDTGERDLGIWPLYISYICSLQAPPTHAMHSPPYLLGQSSFRNIPFLIFPRVIGSRKGHKYRHLSSPLSTLPNSNNRSFVIPFLPSQSDNR